MWHIVVVYSWRGATHLHEVCTISQCAYLGQPILPYSQTSKVHYTWPSIMLLDGIQKKCSVPQILSLLANIRAIQVSLQYNLECGLLYLYYIHIVFIFNQHLMCINDWCRTSPWGLTMHTQAYLHCHTVRQMEYTMLELLLYW